MRSSQQIVSPTKPPSNVVPQNPTVNPTVITRTSSQNPTQNPSPNPSFRPSLNPTQIPTLAPSKTLFQDTFSPTQQGVNSLSSDNLAAKNSDMSTGTLSAIIVSIIVFLVIIGGCVFFINSKQKHTPFEKWVNYYSTDPRNKTDPRNTIDINKNTHVVNDDIHHFYNKNPRLSVNPNPIFTPHVSSRSTFHNSQGSGRYSTQRCSLRGSITLTNKSQKLHNAL
jgi:hypothetical protein